MRQTPLSKNEVLSLSLWLSDFCLTCEPVRLLISFTSCALSLHFSPHRVLSLELNTDTHHMAPCMSSARNYSERRRSSSRREEDRERGSMSKRHCCFSSIGVPPSLWRQSEHWPPGNLTQMLTHRLASIFHTRNISTQQYCTPAPELTSQRLQGSRGAGPKSAPLWPTKQWAKSNRPITTSSGAEEMRQPWSLRGIS